MDNQALIESFFDSLQLGTFIAHAERLNGGLLHENWKVTSSEASYVIKKLNPHVMQKEGAFERYEESEKIAASFYQTGLPAVAALNIRSRYVHPWEKNNFILYPFVEGKIIPLGEINLEQAGIIGQIFAKMHALNLKLPLFQASPYYDIFEDDHWIELINKQENTQLLNLLPVLLNWNDKYRMSIERLNRDTVISHRDLHYSNVLWKGELPHLIDWESAGYTNPLQEIIGYGLEWSGLIDSHFYQDRFNAILNSYRQQLRTSNSSFEDAFFGWLGNSVMGWLEFNLRRSKGNKFTKEEQARGVQIIENTMIPCVNFIYLNMSQILKSIEKAVDEG
ncbi:MAG: phosphotransferase [Chlamydiales bacterium]|nr:phosphotransferase [Chlamydiales bacterium]